MKRRSLLATIATTAAAGCTGSDSTDPAPSAAPTNTSGTNESRIHVDADPDTLPGKYLQAMKPPEGPTGEPFDVLDAGFQDGRLTVTGRLAPTSLYPIQETMSGLEDPFFIDYERFPSIETLERRVADCDGNVIAVELIRREWLERFWNKETSMTVGEYVDLKDETRRGAGRLEWPEGATDGNGAENFVCQDWMEANPDLPELDTE